VLEQVMTGRFADGLGKVVNVPDRVDFDPFPWQSMAVWILTQLKRWNYIKGDINYKTARRAVFRPPTRARMADIGLKAPASRATASTPSWAR
jgi:nitrate/nitrite transport system substrate-binding protein